MDEGIISEDDCDFWKGGMKVRYTGSGLIYYEGVFTSGTVS